MERDSPAAHGSDGSDPEPILRLEDVSRSFGRETAVDRLTLSVRDGELLTLLGPSGCGKTTTLRLIAGLEAPDTGSVTIAGREMATPERVVPPEQRDVGLVFQNYALFPHLTVAENVAFGLRTVSGERTASRVSELLALVDLEDDRDKQPRQLSGGQKQRVALARSLAPAPAILLLDEPFANLDERLRVEMRDEVRAILKEAGVTAISVTHDQEEALTISDRVAVVADGSVEQIGPPTQVFEHPQSRFVANFLGRAGFVSGRVDGDTVETGLGPLSRDRLLGSLDSADGEAVDVLVRPDDLRAVPTDSRLADGQIVGRHYDGPTVNYRVSLADGGVVHCLHTHDETFDRDQPVAVELTADHPLPWYPTQ